MTLWDIKRDTENPRPMKYTMRNTAYRRIRLGKMGVAADVDGVRGCYPRA